MENLKNIKTLIEDFKIMIDLEMDKRSKIIHFINDDFDNKASELIKENDELQNLIDKL